MEKELLSLVYTNRDSYDKVKEHIVESDFSPHGWVLFEEIKKYYEADPEAIKVNKDILAARLKWAYPKSDVFGAIIASFDDNISPPNVLQELYDFKRKAVKDKLATKLLEDKHEDSEGIAALWQEYNNYLAVPELDRVKDSVQIQTARSVSDVVHRLTNRDSIIKLYPRVLNEAVGGGVPMQTHIIVYATPEVGKSAFILNQAVGTAKDGHRVLIFDNEDPEDQTWLRIQSRITGMIREEIYNEPDKCQELLDTCGFYHNIVVVSHNPGTIAELESLIEEVQPKLFICNQIRNLYFKGVEGDVAQLTAAGRAMRSLIKRNNIVGISVTQAADSASRKSVLDIGDVYMSNTSLPGDADLMIGIGGTPDMIENGYRMLSLPKNKITGNHEPLSVGFDKFRSKYTSL